MYTVLYESKVFLVHQITGKALKQINNGVVTENKKQIEA